MTEYVKTIRQKIGHDMLILAGAGVFVHQNGKLLMQRRPDIRPISDFIESIKNGRQNA